MTVLPTNSSPLGSLGAVVVTYRRPAQLRSTLSALEQQSRSPDVIVVVDNDPSSENRDAVQSTSGALYVEATENLGPAGGITLGMETLVGLARPLEWILLVDDDDPPPAKDSVERLLRFAHTAQDAGLRLGGVALTGNRYDRRRGLMVRVPDDELVGVVVVDSISGGQLPIYSVAAINDVGMFRSDLFFGFEELEFGLRLGAAGWDLAVSGEVHLEMRKQHGRLGIGRRERGKTLPAWRRYYSARNMSRISRIYGGRLAQSRVALRTGLVAPLAIAVRRRAFREATMSIRGTLDGLRGVSGRTVDPSSGSGGSSLRLPPE